MHQKITVKLEIVIFMMPYICNTRFKFMSIKVSKMYKRRRKQQDARVSGVTKLEECIFN